MWQICEDQYADFARNDLRASLNVTQKGNGKMQVSQSMTECPLLAGIRTWQTHARQPAAEAVTPGR